MTDNTKFHKVSQNVVRIEAIDPRTEKYINWYIGAPHQGGYVRDLDTQNSLCEGLEHIGPAIRREPKDGPLADTIRKHWEIYRKNAKKNLDLENQND